MEKGISFVLLALFIFGLPVQTFANDWLTNQKDFTRNAVVLGVSAPEDLSVQWTKTSSLSNFQMPVYQDGILYFSEESGVVDAQKSWLVYAVDRKTGEELWRQTGIGLLKCSPVVSGGLIIIPGENLIVLNSKTGEEIWRKKARANYFFVDPMVSGNKLFVIERTIYYYGDLESTNITDGTLSWKKTLDLYGYNPPSFYKDNIIMTTGLSSNFSVVKSYKMSDGVLSWTYQHDYNPNSSVVVDESRGIGVLSLAVNSVAAINLENGQSVTGFSVGSYASKTRLVNGIAYFVTYRSDDTFFNACSYITGQCSVQKKISDGLIYDFRVNSVLVGERFYFTATNGRLYDVNIGDGENKSYPVAEPSIALSYAMYADGMFILSDYNRKELYVLGDGAEPVSVQSSIELVSPYRNDAEYHPYLGQLHSHYIPDIPAWSKLFNGDPTPNFTENKYREAEYDFVALTEHNQVTSDPGVGGILHIANSEEDTQGKGGNHILAVGIQNPIDETLSEQERIDSVASQGGVPILAHPNSKQYPWSLKSMLLLKNYSALEIKNSGISWLDKTGFAGSSLSDGKWDNILSSGKIAYGTAGDDFTPGDPGFDGGAVIVFSQTNSQADILNNFKNGNFYATQGSKAPKIVVSTNNNQIIVSSDRQSTIRFISRGQVASAYKDVDSATYSALGSERYIRAEVESGGKKSWSQPIFVSLKQSAKTPFPGGYEVDLGQAILTVKSSAQIKAATLPITEYPANPPQLGYLSQMYSLGSEGTMTGTKLAVDYKNDKLLTSESNLSIFEYNQSQADWEKIPSTVDQSAKVVTAEVSDPTLYTLSAEEPEDLINPTINLDSSIDLNNFTGEIKALASDNNAVVKASFYIDGNLVSEDTDPSDGWSANVDINNYTVGEHKLAITAEDLSGNVGQSEYTLIVSGSTFQQPELRLSAPGDESELWDTSKIAGGFSSSLPVLAISIFLDDYFVGEAEINENIFSKEINWSEYKEGSHILKAILTDSAGNEAELSKSIVIGQKAIAQIASPSEDSYLQSDKIVFSFSANKEDVIARLDGRVIASETEEYGYELGLGQHTLTVEYDDKVIAQKDFTITTSLADLGRTVDILYKEQHIKNFGVYTMIKTMLRIVDRNEQRDKRNSDKLAMKLLSSIIGIHYKNHQIDQYVYQILSKSIYFLAGQINQKYN